MSSIWEKLALGARFGEIVVSEEARKEPKVLQRITKNVIKESPTEQLTEMYYELLKSNSLRLAQGMGTDETLSGLVADHVQIRRSPIGASF